jgi:hypothetical protein
MGIVPDRQAEVAMARPTACRVPAEAVVRSTFHPQAIEDRRRARVA